MASIPVPGQPDIDEGLEDMWRDSTEGISTIDPATENWKIQTLPLARIKKIMKSEEFILQELEREKQQKAAEEAGQPGEAEKPSVKFMISGEAPVLMSKACELLIKDLSFRAWRHTERNRRRTLQRQDLHAAVGESEVYDFLIDIVPRVTTPKSSPNPGDATAAAGMPPAMPPGIPMGGIPPGMPTQPMHNAPPVGQPMHHMMDSSLMQQMHQPHQIQGQQPQHPTQQHQGMVHHYPDSQQPQQQYQNYMPMQPGQGDDMTHGAPMGASQPVPQGQQAPTWMSQPIQNSGATNS